jgi:hypothetical protein
VCPVSELQDIFERFARSESLSKPTLVSDTFGRQMVKILKYEGCLVDDDQRVDLKALRARMEDGTFEAKLFN